nr:hypothetical protein [Tanacetum cinerariifolium]
METRNVGTSNPEMRLVVTCNCETHTVPVSVPGFGMVGLGKVGGSMIVVVIINKDCFVRDNWINGWSFDWVRNIISGPNASQLALLQNTISAFTLNDSEDSWAWTVGGHSFSVSSARHLIDSRLLPEQGPATRKRYWKSFATHAFGLCGIFGMKRSLALILPNAALSLTRL